MSVSHVTSASDSRVFAITEFKNRLSNVGTSVVLTLAMLRARFETCERIYPASGLVAKSSGDGWEKPADLPLWSAATFTNGARKKALVTHLDLLVIEYDAACPPLDVVLRHWSGYEGFLYTSFNHAPDAPRVRIALTLSRPISREEHELVWQWAQAYSNQIGATVDKSTKDASRIWYVPAVIEGGEYVFESLTGSPLGVDAILEGLRAAKEAEKPKLSRMPNLRELAANELSARRLRGMLERAISDVQTSPKGGRHEALMRVTYNMAGYLGLPGAFSEADLSTGIMAAIMANGGDRDKDGASIRDAIAEGRAHPHPSLPADSPRYEATRPALALAKKLPPAPPSEPEADEDGCLPHVPEHQVDLETVIDEVARDPAAGYKPETLALLASFGVNSQETFRVLHAFKKGGGPRNELKKKIEETARILKSVANDTRPQDGRPTIKVTSDTHTVVARAIETLSGALGLYSRGRSLVQVISSPKDDTGPTIREMPASIVRTLLSSRGVYAKHNSQTGGVSYIEVPDNVVAAVKDQGHWSTVQPLTGLLESPSMRPDGSIIQDPGYDEATGFLYIPSQDFDPVPHSPTQADAEAARALFEDILSDFPFESPVSVSVFLASLLSLLARPAIKGAVPAFLFDANMSGSGKSLLVDLVLLIATGRSASPIAYPGDDTEMEKVLASYAMRGAQFINFDNITRGFGGGPLDKCLTAGGAIDMRVLGRSEAPTLIWKTLVFASVNNASISADTHRRVLICRLENEDESRVNRDDYKYPDLRAHVLEHRGELVGAALTILRAWVSAGRPAMGCKPLGSFEAWSTLVAPALVYAGASNPLEGLAAAKRTEDPWRDALGVFLAGWGKLDPQGQGMTIKQVATRLYPDGPMGPDPLDDIREAIESVTVSKTGRPDSGSLGRLLRGWKGVVRDGMKLDAMTAKGGVNRWYVTRVGIRVPREGIGLGSGEASPPPEDW